MTTVTHVHDPDADPAFHETVRTLGGKDLVVVRGRAGRARDVWIHEAILAAMGKTYGGAAELARARSHAAGYVVAWLVAEGIKHVLMYDATVVAGNDHRTLAEIATLADADLTIVSDGLLSGTSRKAMRRWTDRMVTAADFKAAVAPVHSVTEETPAEPPGGTSRLSFPTPPGSDFLTFRADARARMSPEDFAVLDARYVEVGRSFTVPDGPTEESLSRRIFEWVVGCNSREETVVVLRAIQAVCFRRGIHVDVDIDGVLAAAQSDSALRRLTPAQWDAIHGAVRPFYPSLVALVAAGVGTNDLADLPAQDVALDGTTVTLHGDILDVPAGGRKALRAQHVVHAWAGYSPEEPFLWDTARRRARDMTGGLNNLTQHFGIPIRVRAQEGRSQGHWQYRWGVTITDFGAA